MSFPDSSTTLNPDYRLPLVLILLALPLGFLSFWLTAGVALFGLFLAIQAATLRLVFTASALDIYRSEEQIRHFPYETWLHWQIYLPALPILFYFRETRSIHFLPIIFAPDQLQQCLWAYVGDPGDLNLKNGVESDPEPEQG
ncbi:MAG: DUF3119 family protein [Synechococcaceae cyanobacterium SM2_3_1]|nr:DUF3119 family protein [Synechococcaceae cyanobacterium SM2_3_1]